ncbi:cytochrome b-c1 complex subunit 7-2 [Quercus suber]|uniref:Complex III subunit VII n=1 Tax=Quercus suber TaxID=58331 RepID=A0AAW0L503_QUESU
MASPSWLQALLNPNKNWFAKQHMKTVSQRLRNYGRFGHKGGSGSSPSRNRGRQKPEAQARYGSLYEARVPSSGSSGLRFEDLYDPKEDLDIKEALDRLPREIVDARNQRLKRAMDLSMKHEYLPQDLQALQTPFRSYLKDMLALVKKERAEREALGALPLYQRTIP